MGVWRFEVPGRCLGTVGVHRLLDLRNTCTLVSFDVYTVFCLP